MKTFLKSFLGCLVAILVTVLIIVVVVAAKSSEKPKIEKNSYLVVDLYGDVMEYDPPTGMMGFMGGGPETLTRILDNLEKAAVDDRIEGVIVKMSSSNGAGLAKIQEIRAGLKKVKDAGKKVYGFADTMDPKTYLLAAACDSIYMPPPAYVSFKGFAARSVHVKGSLEKLGINPNFHKIKDYKSAAELFTRKDMSDAARENTEWILDEIWDWLMGTILEDRGLTEAQVVQVMELAVLSADEALAGGLIDEILYWDEFEKRLMGDEEELLTVCQCDYESVEREKVGLKGDRKIAVVHAQGMIGGRQSGTNPMFGTTMGHESINAALREAREDEDVAAIVFRIDSPGGEGLASDLMCREVWVTREDKPIVASMVDVAASGGYYIAYTATKIVANPLTLTGSIGSISGKFNVQGLNEKLGLSFSYVTRGPMALFWSEEHDFTKEQWDRFTQNHWDGFNVWLRDVAEKRNMTFEEAEKLAHGRVWMGAQAKENGLIDEVGGLYDAIALAKELGGIPADEEVTIVHYPQKKGFLETLMSGGGFAAAANWVIYDFVRTRALETWNLLTGGGAVLLREDLVIE